MLLGGVDPEEDAGLLHELRRYRRQRAVAAVERLIHDDLMLATV